MEEKIKKITEWIDNTINPNKLDKNLLETIEKELDDDLFNSYLKYILSDQDSISLEYISPDKKLYELMLFEDILSVDHGIYVNIDADCIGTWWREKILPLFKANCAGDDLDHKLNLEIKKIEIIDFHSQNFQKFKNEIIAEINKEISNSKNIKSSFEDDERKFLEKRMNSLEPKNILELEQSIDKIELKYDANKFLLKDYCSRELAKILKDDDQNVTLKELDKFVNKNREFINEDVFLYIDMQFQKEIQKIEESLLNDICDVKDLKSLEALHNKIIQNGEFVKCEDIESIIFTKLESLIKNLNLAEINDEENIAIGNLIYDNTSSIDLEKYPIAEILICRGINIDLNNVEDTIDDLNGEIQTIKDLVLKNCMFNCEYYNLNIQVNGNENYHNMKFKYLTDLVDYIKLKSKKSIKLDLKGLNKNVQYKRRIFSKGNEALIKEIDDFYIKNI